MEYQDSAAKADLAADSLRTLTSFPFPFWQKILGAELSPIKAREIIAGLDPFTAINFEGLANHPLLTATESERMRLTEIGPLEKYKSSRLAVIDEENFPTSFQDAEGSPPAFFYDGDLDALHAPMVGIVGTRNATTYGRAVARKFSERLAESGVTIVSGGALGIDAASHEGALAVGGRTIAIMGSGLDQLYPAMHKGMFQRIAERGGLVSTYSFGSKPKSHRFLERNWIIAAMTLATIVIEAPQKSGALKTASDAAELGRPILVVPSNIENFNFRGSHGLIRDGATLIDHPDQVFEAISWYPATSPVSEKQISEAANKIFTVLETSSQRVELIAQKTGLSTGDLLAELTMLELEGKVMRDAGGYALIP